MARQGAVLSIQRNGAFEVRDRFGMLVALRVSDREHVERVVVVGVLVANEAKVCDGFVVASAVERQRGRVQPLVNGLR